MDKQPAATPPEDHRRNKAHATDEKIEDVSSTECEMVQMTEQEEDLINRMFNLVGDRLSSELVRCDQAPESKNQLASGASEFEINVIMGHRGVLKGDMIKFILELNDLGAFLLYNESNANRWAIDYFIARSWSSFDTRMPYILNPVTRTIRRVVTEKRISVKTDKATALSREPTTLERQDVEAFPS
ncbi:hypothetical protein KFK09_005004 [Dendrobium nobile]|uniref:Uncharacterized protein n=1 Tax=Dendrobium nobile TaxID=94219 RepID=A0A8T3BZK7_DENNO|nr:hypothetical protein KFK09_005004 [Dendrobium nobile]